MTSSAAPWWFRWRHGSLALALAAAALAVWPASRLQLDQSIESFYPPDSPALRDYRHSKRWFGGDEFVLVVFEHPTLLDVDGGLTDAARDELRGFAEQLTRIPGVDSSGTRHLGDALAFDRFAFLAAGREPRLRLAEGLLLGPDRRTTAIILRLLPEGAATRSRRETIGQIRAVAAAFPRPTHVVGEPVQVHDTFRYIEEDGAVLGWASLVLLALVIGGIFRRARWVLLPLVIVEVAILWTKGILAVSGLPLSMVGSMVNSLLTVIGTATVIHVIVRYREYAAVQGAEQATRSTWDDLAVPILWTTLTTAAGFAAQCSSHVAPVKSFGLMMMVGTLFVLIACFAILPAVLGWGSSHRSNAPDITTVDRVPAHGVPAHGVTAHGITGVERWLGRLHLLVERHPSGFAAFGVLVLFWSLAGITRLRVETDFSRNFRPETPIVRSLEVVETRLGGAGVWEVHFTAPARLDQPFLDRVSRVADQLRAVRTGGGQSPTKVLALTDGLALVPPLPLAMRLAALRQLRPDWEPSFYRGAVDGESMGRMRIMLRARERQSAEDKVALIGEVERVARAEFPDARAAGIFVLFTGLIQSVLSDQWVSFLYGGAAILGLMTLAFRRWRWGLLSLVPNLFPIGVVLGTVGWLGLPINLGTAMISSVSLGLTVDSSIHYFAGYLRAVRRGRVPHDALRETTMGVGAALVYTNLALIAGFLVLTCSHFLPLVDFGILVSVAMLGGLLGNLVFLPLLMRVGGD